ncbi:thymidine phosphorylase [Paracoccus sp. 1_MG-2023]|uniref:thymidine phosphorylase n=1 Tax=unclassified Paracoccus (in: a-proteobacteria) TaxID=2688777 RepID=UPI001C080DF5|nr:MULTISPECIES: thymidine phosphorylase [unclassified Paracoccus (in: a-proteobacteria)]MBU2958690.1 thymidine phosphorylase [Paracoccus sp. C2R09]MDO6667683.1 thymidine phosphorylase [Paracoccus sp. 1_MG-2023]
MTDPRPVIAAVRNGRGLDGPGAALIAQGLADGSVSDAQAGAFAMAVLTRGTGDAGRVALTRAMRDSGDVLHWDLPGPVVDKHSTGGIGDTTSLILAPLLAAAGVFVPMISGRGLGHTGGTLDKLEAIPGFRCDQPEDAFRRIVTRIGCAIVSATGDVAPADRRLYAIRDESGAVESIDLITASILSKKLAAGIDALVLDVKAGSGAFMREDGGAQRLAQALVSTANGAGCRCSALITDMDQPLARSAGNAVEVHEAIRVLKGEHGPLRDLTLALAGECLALAGRPSDGLAGLLDSGAAAEVFGRMVAAQGGPADLVDRPETHLPQAPVIRPVPAPEGRVGRIDVTALGHAVVALGGGRVRKDEAIDHAVGLTALAKLGEETGPDRPLAMVHAADDTAADIAIAAVQAAYGAGDTEPGPLVRERITA